MSQAYLRNISPDSSAKVVDGGTANTSAPGADDDGFSTRGAEYLHLLVRVTTGVDFDLHLWATMKFADDGGNVWGRLEHFGSSGVQSFAVADGVKYVIVPLRGADRVAFQLQGIAGGEVVDIWAGTASFD